MRPSASGFGFAGAACCAGRADGCEDEAAQSVRSEGDRSFGFWPRTTSRGKACAGESAQAVASLRDLIFEGTAQKGRRKRWRSHFGRYGLNLGPPPKQVARVGQRKR